MKLILSMLLMLPVLTRAQAPAQECKLLNEKDPYTKETKLSSGALTLQGAILTIDADKKEIDFFFELKGKCFNDMSTAVIHYETTKVKTTWRNAGSMNCDGYFHFKFRNGTTTPAVLSKLETQKVSQFVFKGSDDKEVIVTLTPAQQQALQDVVGCVNREAKGLNPQ
ncbi:MAG: hypothetical protein DI535_15340 [Citrobacter freundii]|nr:MAG: hypothetical protein DI535_15340 [Citrobacter freundii]